MPVMACTAEGKPGYKYGDSGKCYTYSPGDEPGRKEAKRKAHIQGAAIAESTGEKVTEDKGLDVADVHVATPKLKKSVDLFKMDDEQRLVYGVVLVPDIEDLQGDICSKESIQEAAHDYLVNSRLVKAQHRAPTDADVVECYIAPCDIPIGQGIAPAGSWIMVTKIHSGAMWEAIKKGDITGYSIGGTGTREEM
jgi:hypothetical protein